MILVTVKGLDVRLISSIHNNMPSKEMHIII